MFLLAQLFVSIVSSVSRRTEGDPFVSWLQSGPRDDGSLLTHYRRGVTVQVIDGVPASFVRVTFRAEGLRLVIEAPVCGEQYLFPTIEISPSILADPRYGKLRELVEYRAVHAGSIEFLLKEAMQAAEGQ